MAKLWHTKLTPSSFAATTAATGYPAANVGLQSLARPWRSTTTGANDVTINFSVATPVQVLHAHDANFASASVQKSVSGGAFVAVGTLTTYTDENGRRRGFLTINEPLCTALKIVIASGTPSDSLAYWRVGAAYAFQTVITLPVGPDIGFDIDTQKARIGAVLANKQKAIAQVGINYDLIKLNWTTEYVSSLATLLQKTQLATCLFSTDLTNYPEEIWPVIEQEGNSSKSRFDWNVAKRSITLTEVV